MVITLLVLKFSPDQLGQWLRALATAFISALFAIAVGLGLFNRQIHVNEERRRQQLLEVLKAEIRDIKNELSSTDPGSFTSIQTASGNTRQFMLPLGFELITFDEVVRSALLPTQVTVQVIYLAGGVRAYNARVHRAQSIIQAEIIAAEEVTKRGAGYLLDHNVDNLEQHRQKVIDECDRMLNTLEQLRL